MKCYVNCAYLSIILYADDIPLLAPSVESLQKLVTMCATELASLDMSINSNKSVCMRIGPRFNKHCANISVKDGHELNWVQSCRYLGITVESASHFKCNIGEEKKSFYTDPLMQYLVELVELQRKMSQWNY